jgi:hypothetical protein
MLPLCEVAMHSADLDSVGLESLEVGAAPVVRHFLRRLDLPRLFQQHLAALPGRQPALPTAVALGVLLTNLLLARQPLYALPAWVARQVPEHLGLQGCGRCIPEVSWEKALVPFLSSA